MADDIKLTDKLGNVITSYENVCRLCLLPITYSSDGAGEGVSLFSTYENNIPLSQLIEHSIKIEVIFLFANPITRHWNSVHFCFQLKEDDLLPNCICHECYQIILNFSEYRTKCESNNRELQKFAYARHKNADRMKDEVLAASTATEMFLILERVDGNNQNHSNKVNEDGSTRNSFGIDAEYSMNSDCDMQNDAREPNPTTPVMIADVIMSNVSKKKRETAEKTRKVCEECGLTFSTTCTLKRHRLTHTGRKDFCCDICNNRFARKFHLEMHMRIHFKIRPHICETCASTFSTSSDLTRHRRVHVDVKNYACVVCERRFKRSNDVTKHMRTHSGEKGDWKEKLIHKFICRISCRLITNIIPISYYSLFVQGVQ